MRTRNKNKAKPDVELCAAVRRIREAHGWSQDRMARETKIAMQTISRFELGKQVPRDYFVLRALSYAAADAGLVAEEKLFADTVDELAREPGGVDGYAPPVRSHRSGPSRQRVGPILWIQSYTPQQWRLMQAARIAKDFFPEAAKAMERAAGPALALVDEIITGAATEDRVLDSQFYSELEHQLGELAARKVFQNFKKEGGQ